MKKILFTLITLFLLIMPVRIKAMDCITNYYIDATILSNGDINVKEIFTMNGTFNGMNRILNYRGSNTPFDGEINSFKGSDIYNGDSIILNEVKGISFNSALQFNDLFKNGDLFEEVNFANKGDYGVFTKTVTPNGIDLLIYNPNRFNKAFYLDYTITNMAIIHNDIAELGFNIFTELSEYVNNLVMYIHIPNNEELLRVWAHGPLWGNTEIVDKNTIKLTIENLDAYTAIDVRLAFDKSVLSQSQKISNVDALDKIVTLETKQAELANEEREEAKKIIQKEKTKEIIFDIVKVLWLIGDFAIIFLVYKKHDKEYESSFKTKYFRDFPSDNTPTTVGYLIRHQINNDDLSASILMLIYKKVLTFEELGDKKKDYNLRYHTTTDITDQDKKLIEFLFTKSFDEIIDNDAILLSTLKKNASKKYTEFLRKYTDWKTSVTIEATEKNFFETKGKVKLLTILYSILGIAINIFSLEYMNYDITFILMIVMFIAAISSLIYYASFTRRTASANEEYVRWIGLKDFMKDFGTMDKKELPEIMLWEKYLVYAVTLGCADKLAKDMKIRAEELTEMQTDSLLFDYYRFNTLLNFNRVVNNTVNNSVSSAYNAKSIAESNSSSGSGFGGGFSGGFGSGGGGGSFGGGGGGGRF